MLAAASWVWRWRLDRRRRGVKMEARASSWPAVEGEKRDPATGFLSRGRPLKKTGMQGAHISPTKQKQQQQLSHSREYFNYHPVVAVPSAKNNKPVLPSCLQLGAISSYFDAGMSNTVSQNKRAFSNLLSVQSYGLNADRGYKCNHRHVAPDK